MKLLFDFFPILLFFIGFKLFGLYTATFVAIVASIVQVAINWIRHQRFDQMHLITMAIVVVLGGATLYFHNPLFIKWKPTVVYWVTGLAFLISHFFNQKNLIQKLMEKNIQLPDHIWMRLNFAWVIFFAGMGIANICIAYHYDLNTWVNFKFFGGLGLTIIFVLIQAIYLSKHLVGDKLTPLDKTKS